jgi:hypothetical protein
VDKMPRRALNETVRGLRSELASGAPLSAEQRAALDTLLREIEPLLAEDAADDEHGPLVTRLRNASEGFEESHPNLTLAVGAVADALSRMGL